MKSPEKSPRSTHRRWPRRSKSSLLGFAVAFFFILYASSTLFLHIRVQRLGNMVVIEWDRIRTGGASPSANDVGGGAAKRTAALTGGGGAGGGGGNASIRAEWNAAAGDRGDSGAHVIAGDVPRTNWAASRYAGGGEGGRFPARGTDEFARECGWTMVPPPKRDGGDECTILVRPRPGGNEGISDWVVTIVRGYIRARQSGCRLMIDYGAGVDVRRVMEPLTDAAVGTGADEGLYDWSVPEGFWCKVKNRCSLATDRLIRNDDSPRYRLALLYNHPPKEGELCVHCVYDDAASKLQRNLPGFKIESGFSCSFANLFRPAPAAAEYEPRLFTEILPTLRDPEAFVLAIYIRTGQTDQTANFEERKKKGENITVPVKEMDFKHRSKIMLNCAKEVEQSYLTGSTDALRGRESYSMSVWIILTDSPNLKEWAVSTYAGLAVPASYHRTVLVTGSRGVHTRTRRNPSTADFAEALLDWYLIGESDAVIQSGPSFGTTASFRTARPSYDAGHQCSRRIMVHQRPHGPSNETKATVE